MTSPGGTVSISPTTRSVLRWHEQHAWIADCLAALAICLVDIPLGLAPLTQGITTAPPRWQVLTLGAWLLMGAAIIIRRWRPVLAWTMITALPALHLAGASALYALGPGDSFFVVDSLNAMVLLGTPLTLAPIADRYHMRAAAAACLLSTLITGTLYARTGAFSWSALVSSLLPYALLNVIGTLVGLLIRFQRTQLRELQDRSARQALAAEQQMRLAAANERSRIAREMHDIVAHSLAVMITMADGAAASIDRNPAMTKQALTALAETGRSALADTRRLVGVLRDDPGATSAPADAATSTDTVTEHRPDGEPTVLAATASQSAAASNDPAAATTSSIPVVRDLPVPEFAPPGTVAPSEPDDSIVSLRTAATGTDVTTGEIPLAPAPESGDLSGLVARFRDAGVPVTYRWEGGPLPEDRSLSLALFRIAQEALTNILRYAPTTKHVEVTVTRFTGAVTLEVLNEAAPGSRPMHGSGKGLIGMRERAAVYGGSVDAGPTPTGWKVQAVLRWDEEAPAATWQLPQ